MFVVIRVMKAIVPIFVMNTLGKMALTGRILRQDTDMRKPTAISCQETDFLEMKIGATGRP